MNRSGIVRSVHWILLAVLLLTGCQPTPTASRPAPIIVLWHPFTGNEAAAIQRLSDKFTEENPWHIHLLAEYQREIPEKLATSPENRPDLVIVWPEEAREYRQAGFSIAPTPLPETDALPDLLPMARALYSSGEELDAIPLGLSTYVVYYNTDWLGDLGYETIPTTWGNLIQVACAATDVQSGQTGLTLPAQAGMFLALMAAQGSPLMDPQTGAYRFDDTAGAQAGEALQTLLSSSCGSAYEVASQGINQLGNSTLPILIENSLNRKPIERSVTAHRNFALTLGPIPGAQDAGPTLWYGPGLALTAPEGPRREAARHALSWFLSAAAQEDWSAATEYLPVRRSLLEEAQQQPALSALDQALIQLTLDAADHTPWVTWPRRPRYEICRAALVRTLAFFGKEGTASLDLLRQAQQKCNGESP